MSRQVSNNFNRGEIDADATAREDIPRINSSGSLMTNFLPMRLGPMLYRPGTEYLGSVAGEAYNIPFVAATDDVALLEFSNNLLRIWVSDALVTRTSVTSAIVNGTFDSNITGWTDDSGTGSTTAWKSGGYASLKGASSTKAVLYQTIGSTDVGSEHGIRFIIAQAPIVLKLGTTGAGSSDIYSGTLLPGTHSLAVTPPAALTITLENSAKYEALVDSVVIEAAGTVTLPTAITTAKLPSIRQAQSADVIYTAYNTSPGIRVERRGVKSWSIVDYRANDGPFEKINNTDITLTAAALGGDTTLTASDDFFEPDHVGALFKLASLGQIVQATVSAEDNGTASIEVNGVSTSRNVGIVITGISDSTVTLQRSSDDFTWEDVRTYTTAKDVTYNDSFDNSSMHYRLYIKAGNYGTDTVVLKISNTGGSIEGIARVTGYTSATVADVQVLTSFGATAATRDWYEGSWSDKKGNPSAVEFYEGRLWWAGKNKIWGSVSDAYASFDRDLEGNSKSIQRTIGFGPVDSVHWLAKSSRLLMGIASDEIAVRSTSLGEILTADNANLKSGTSQGVANIEPVKIDDSVIFTQRSGTKLFYLTYDFGSDRHQGPDLMTLHPTICSAGIKRIAVARQPESRVFVVLNDGGVRVYLTDVAENVAGWSRIETDGAVEDVIILPGVDEDRVYFVINRTGGRYLEKLAKLTEVEGGAISKHFDSFRTYSSPGTTITGLSHLEGKTVGVWADGQDRGTYTVASSQITVPSSWTDVVVGLVHTADYVSNKLKAPGDQVKVSALNERKRVVDVGVILRNYWPGSLQIGPSVALLEGMPDIEGGTTAGTTTQDYDEVPCEFNGENESDPRIYMRATGPCKILALTYGLDDGTDSSPSTPGR